MMRKDIFGNEYKVIEPKQMTYAQKLREAKAKQKYKQFQAEQRAMQIQKFRESVQKSRMGLKKIGSKTKSGYKRATDKRLPSFRDKLRGSIYKKE